MVDQGQQAKSCEALVVGAGPAGLMAAEAMARAGLRVLIVDAMPSPARKFLMAGKSGLNLTKDEPLEDFLRAFHPLQPALRMALQDFGPDAVKDFAIRLGQQVFTGSTGRVFPLVMKGSPLLRGWLARLDGLGVTLRTRWHWTGWQGEALLFDTPQGPQALTPAVTVLACGGASWARLGSDGGWADFIPDTAPFAPANMGLNVLWSGHMAPHFGTPIKGAALHAGDQISRGEWVISARGIEGGGIYPLSRPLREEAPLMVDFFPDLAVEDLRQRLARPRGKSSLANHLRKTIGLAPAAIALVQEFARPLPDDLAPLLKALPIHHAGPRPLDEAISVAGGLRFDALDDDLMLRVRPGTFAAGEMLDWEAPTGGYLLTGCFATGLRAGQSAAVYYAKQLANARGAG
ncbi:TIGR03862 family flavoprotein [Ketogulonicigenium vulgare]|uniref:NAD(FAD)-utilizing dehydrogenase n=1 Tax=Ketogulonicigenium vulgare (strain WSH-001) TaxID=759362 RepID=F9Y6M1_KETVW|nr:TIGR03862 family flavoprotein [Ketogulonicigenium vulgare]ADO43883.1 conserved hypothetical protein [Ketogulonicigenium vulgare Y25]AEM42141.1 hypothetical protein KVU_2302 [Ketogulonicigenium vulgare WSH-001]ALJ79766.1 NAD(FAD)-utilizing dehydrogenase [Ketogulonicigenium vulgare]ANW32686.1 NAD(FAD)-utilizing dehydrogenase [Ketogulonicigenium vulgare]AOZ55917.1 hypothetical protein KVC_2915 [Ketogulonicigenium vulgare]